MGARIIRLRKAQKPEPLSQEALGALCGVTKSAVSQWESDTTAPNLQTILQLRSRLRFSLDWLLTGEGDMNGGFTYDADPLIARVVTAMQHMKEEDERYLVITSEALVAKADKLPQASKPARRAGEINYQGATDYEFYSGHERRLERKDKQ